VDGSVSFTDVTAETYLTDPLYTNARTGEVSDNPLDRGNARPPLAKDLAYWKERTWFSNTTSRHTLELDLLGVGARPEYKPVTLSRSVE
jgi:hypothetical protein